MNQKPASIYGVLLVDPWMDDEILWKVINEEGDTLQKAKIGVDRDTTSFEKLKSHLTKTLKLKSKFMLMYQMKKSIGNGTMGMTDDWDLDRALEQSRHSLKIIVQTRSQQSPSDSVPGDCTMLPTEGVECDTTQTTHGDGVTSILDRFIDKMEDLFSFNDSSVDPTVPLPKSKAPMTFKEFQNYLDVEGRLENYKAFRESIYRGGIAPAMRKIAWRHLLCVYPEGMTAVERQEYLKEKSDEYTQLKDKWRKVYKDGKGEQTEHMRFVTSMVKKDVVRTDRNTSYYKGREDNKHTMSLFNLLCTYSLNHPNVSYCQGMCDLASPILAVQDNEAHAYLLFCSLMQRVKYNFSFDSIAITIKFEHLTRLLMHFDPEFYAYLQEHQVENLLFAYRWLLLEMKREFPFDDSLYFTEVMWSSLPMLPSDTEIPLFEDGEAVVESISHIAMAAFGKSTQLDSDTESFVTAGSSAGSDDFPDCGNMSADHSLVLKQEYVERALMEEDEEEDSDTVFSSSSSESDDSDEGANADHEESELYTDLQSAENGELSTLQCSCHNHQTQRQTAENETHDDEKYTTLSMGGQRQGSDSVDSGFGSRPSSPSQQHHDLQSTESHLLEEEQHPIFPPPKEFGFGNPFLIFAALALILEQRDLIMSKKMDFNDIVMLFSGYKSHYDVHSILKESKQLYEAYISDGLEFDEDEFEHLDVP